MKIIHGSRSRDLDPRSARASLQVEMSICSPVSASPKIKKVCYDGSAINGQIISLQGRLLYIRCKFLYTIQFVVLYRRIAVKAENPQNASGDKATTAWREVSQ